MAQSDARTGTRRGLALAALAVLALCALAVPPLVSSRIQGGLERSLRSAEDISGEVGDVELCLRCGGYTVVDPVVRTRGGGDGEPLFEAERVEVGVQYGRLLGGEWVASLRLREPRLRVDIDRAAAGERTALDVDWGRVGAALFPAPIDDLEIAAGTLSVRHRGLDPPVEWRFAGIEATGRHLAPPRRTPARIEAQGSALGEGSFQGRAKVRRADAPEEQRFDLEGAIRDVPLRELRAYLGSVGGLDPAGGHLSARFALEGSARGWQGRVHCRLREVDVLALRDLADLEDGKILWEILAAGLATGAQLGQSEQPIALTFRVEEDLGEPQLDAWAALAELVRRALLLPFAAPMQILETLRDSLAEGAAES